MTRSEMKDCVEIGCNKFRLRLKRYSNFNLPPEDAPRTGRGWLTSGEWLDKTARLHRHRPSPSTEVRCLP